MNISIVGAAKYEQKQQQIAAAVTVITRKDITTYGWRTLNEGLASLPGIHSTYDYQYDYLGTRGFGLPGDFNTRVLITINGNRINDATYDQGPTGRYFPLDIDLIERIEFGHTGISGVARGMDGENVKQLFARASRGPLSFDFIYSNRRKDDPTGMFFSDPLVAGQFQRDRCLNTQIQYNDNFSNDTLNVLGRLFLGQYRYENPLVYNGEKIFSPDPVTGTVPNCACFRRLSPIIS